MIVRPERLSVHVTTANFIFPDWKSKTNAVASFHFGRLAGAAPAAPADGFGSDLLEYYAALKAIGARPPPAWKVDKGQRPPTDAECAAWAALPLGWLADYDYSGARARLVASVPGTSAGVSAGRHAGPALHRCGRGSTGPTWPQDASAAWGVRRRWHRPGCPVAALQPPPPRPPMARLSLRHPLARVAPRDAPKLPRPRAPATSRWGHMRLRHELRAEGLADRFEDAALDLQFSSLSSVGNDTKWLEELAQSLCGGDKARPRLRFVFPTRDQARPLPAPAKGCTPERAAPSRPAQASPHSQLGARRGGPSTPRACLPAGEGLSRGVGGRLLHPLRARERRQAASEDPRALGSERAGDAVRLGRRPP